MTRPRNQRTGDRILPPQSPLEIPNSKNQIPNPQHWSRFLEFGSWFFDLDANKSATGGGIMAISLKNRKRGSFWLRLPLDKTPSAAGEGQKDRIRKHFMVSDPLRPPIGIGGQWQIPR